MPSLHHTRARMSSLSALEQQYLWRWLIVSVLGGCRNCKSFTVGNETVKMTEILLRVSPFGKLIIGLFH